MQVETIQGIEALLQKCGEIARSFGYHVQDPAKAYREGHWVPQIRCSGNLYYYQLPNEGEVLAVWQNGNSYGIFFDHEEL